MTQRFTLEEIRTRTYKDRDAWWTVLLVDPLAARLVRLVAPYRAVTPNRLTLAALMLGVAAAACFLRADPAGLLAGALLFHLSFVVDCMDGKIARLNGTGSPFGAWLDYVFDRLRVLTCAAALFGGQWARTGDAVYLWSGAAVVFLDMFRYLNALQMGKVKNDLRARLAAAHGDARPVFVEETGMLHPLERRREPGVVVDATGAERPVVDVYGDFRTRFRLFVRLRNTLVRHRIRAHLFSGIEFQMAVFVVAPLTGAIVPVTAGAGVLLLVFELLLIYKLWTATRGLAPAAAPAPAGAPHAEKLTGPAGAAAPVSVTLPAQGAGPALQR